VKLQADLHVHTIASGHGYSTIKEIVEMASVKGLKMVGITDHGLKMPGAPHLYYFTNMISLPREVQGVKVLRGVEANILDTAGNIDMPEIVLSSYLDLVLAGFHDETGYTGKSVEENTRAMIAAIQNPYVHIIVHPGNPNYPVDVERVVRVAKEYNKAIELNNNSAVVRPGSLSRCALFAKQAKKYGVWVSLNSDAHICYNVGNNEQAINLALEAGINPDQVLNSSTDKVSEFLAWHKNRQKILKGA